MPSWDPVTLPELRRLLSAEGGLGGVSRLPRRVLPLPQPTGLPLEQSSDSASPPSPAEDEPPEPVAQASEEPDPCLCEACLQEGSDSGAPFVGAEAA